MKRHTNVITRTETTMNIVIDRWDLLRFCAEKGYGQPKGSTVTVVASSESGDHIDDVDCLIVQFKVREEHATLPTTEGE